MICEIQKIKTFAADHLAASVRRSSEASFQKLVIFLSHKNLDAHSSLLNAERVSANALGLRLMLKKLRRKFSTSKSFKGEDRPGKRELAHTFGDASKFGNREAAAGLSNTVLSFSSVNLAEQSLENSHFVLIVCGRSARFAS